MTGRVELEVGCGRVLVGYFTVAAPPPVVGLYGVSIYMIVQKRTYDPAYCTAHHTPELPLCAIMAKP